MVEQVLHYKEIQDNPEEQETADLDRIYSIANSDFSAEEFLEKSLSKEIDILKEEIENCEQELAEREKLHEEQTEDLKEKAQEYRSALTNFQKLNDIAKGDSLQEKKANTNEKIGAVEEQLREEERENWKDQQELRDKIRELRKEVQELKKRKSFMKIYAKSI